MKAINKLSDNDLNELMFLMDRIKSEIETFAHVEEYIPLNMTNIIDSFSDKLVNEYDKRRNE